MDNPENSPSALAPFWRSPDSEVTLYKGDCRDIMAALPEASVDSVVCDPPYGLRFMRRDWDRGVPGEHFWREALRVAKPGAHLLAFGGTRTFHRLVCAIEDAGWEVRDAIGWLYGSGFPKSRDASKAIDEEAGAKRETVGFHPRENFRKGKAGFHNLDDDNELRGKIEFTAPASPAARQWQGWGTALKPAMELICVARKPLEKGLTVAGNVLKHGTGAINVDGCKIPTETDLGRNNNPDKSKLPWGGTYGAGPNRNCGVPLENQGRWPANVIHDGSEEVLELFPVLHGSGNKSDVVAGIQQSFRATSYSLSYSGRALRDKKDGSGSAARFFYCAKASRRDREEGLEETPMKEAEGFDAENGGYNVRSWIDRKDGKGPVPVNAKRQPRRNNHPTVKPTDLMRYLCRLVTRPGGIVLDPFMGSGSTGKAAALEGFRFIGIDLDEQWCGITQARIAFVLRQPDMFSSAHFARADAVEDEG